MNRTREESLDAMARTALAQAWALLTTLEQAELYAARHGIRDLLRDELATGKTDAHKLYRWMEATVKAHCHQDAL